MAYIPPFLPYPLVIQDSPTAVWEGNTSRHKHQEPCWTNTVCPVASMIHILLNPAKSHPTTTGSPECRPLNQARVWVMLGPAVQCCASAGHAVTLLRALHSLVQTCISTWCQFDYDAPPHSFLHVFVFGVHCICGLVFIKFRKFWSFIITVSVFSIFLLLSLHPPPLMDSSYMYIWPLEFVPQFTDALFILNSFPPTACLILNTFYCYCFVVKLTNLFFCNM